MGKREVERLHQSLGTHMSNIHETLQILDQKPASSLQKVSWHEAIKIGEQVSKHATTGISACPLCLCFMGLSSSLKFHCFLLRSFMNWATLLGFCAVSVF